MSERTPLLDFICHIILIIGALAVCLPLYFVFVAGSLTQQDVLNAPMSWLPGDQFLANLKTVWSERDFRRMLINSFIVATGITVGKISVSLLAAFAVTYFRFPFRRTAFWLIFISLMLPIEVRIVPTYESAANVALPYNIMVDWLNVSGLIETLTGSRIDLTLNWNLTNSYEGLIFPLIASATATFLFRQFFLTIPEELCEAARIDNASPMQFFRYILLPLSRSNIVALAIILFLYGWNQYLWPLLLTTDQEMNTAIIGLKSLIPRGEAMPIWHIMMNATLLTMLPPTLIILIMQRWFVKGLVDNEK